MVKISVTGVAPACTHDIAPTPLERVPRGLRSLTKPGPMSWVDDEVSAFRGETTPSAGVTSAGLLVLMSRVPRKQ